MRNTHHIGSLCHAMPSRDWNAVLGLGRHVEIPSSSWLESHSKSGEHTAVFLSGRVGLRSVHEDEDTNEDIVPYPAPAILTLSGDEHCTDAHWVLVRSTVCFFTHTNLKQAFGVSSQFASNFVAALQQQTRHHVSSATQAENGLDRLSASLLSRSWTGNGQRRKVQVTQSQLATETGLSRQWVNRLLKQLEHQGIAECGRGHILLHAPARLENVYDHALSR